MNPGKSNSRFNFCIILFLLIPFNILAQAKTISSLPKADTSSNNESGGSRHSLFTGIGYGSNMIYMGSTISGNQPYGYTSLTYGYNSEFFASVSAIHLSGYNPFFSFFTGSLNYNHVFNSWLDISSGLYRYQATNSVTDTLFSNFTYADLTLGIDWRLIYSKISLDGLFSDENRAYLQIKNSRYFQTSELMKKKFYISFDPFVNLLFGTLTKANTTTGSSVMIFPPYHRWKFYRQRTANTTYSGSFGLMEIDFGLPVALNFNKMTLEAEASYILPAYNDSELPGSRGFVFLLSGYFRIF